MSGMNRPVTPQRLRGRPAEGPAVAARPGERRGEAPRTRRKTTKKKDGEDKEATRRARTSRRRAREKAEAPGEGRRSTSSGIDQRILALPVPADNYVGLGAGQGRAGSSSCKAPARRRRSAATARPPRRRPLRPGEAQDRRRSSPASAEWSLAVGRREAPLQAGRRAGSSPGRTRPRRPARAALKLGRRPRCRSIRAPSGGRCTARPGASSATSSTTPASTASTSRPPRRSTRRASTGLRQPRRPQLPLRGDARRADARPRLRGGGDGPEAAEGQGRPARRRLRDRERPLPLRARLRRRELEPRPARAADPARRQRRRRASTCSRSNGAGAAAAGRASTACFEATAGKAVVLRVGPSAGRHGRARRHGRPGRRRVGAAPPRLDRGQPPQGRRALERPARLRLPARHRRAAATRPSTATSSRRSTRQGAVLDERYNGGGLLADYIIDFLRRPLMSYAVTREGSTFVVPARASTGRR